MWLRRGLALLLAIAAPAAGLASLTVARGDNALALAEAGRVFDSTAKARVLRKITALSQTPGTAADGLLSTSELEEGLQDTYRREPINRAAYTGLALLMRESRDPRFSAFVDASLRASPRTPSLIGLALEQAAQTGDQVRALALLDRMMRLRPANMREFMPQFVAQIASDPNAFDLDQSLRMEPLWAPMFLSLAADEPDLLPRLLNFRLVNPDIEISNEAIDAKLVRKAAEAGDIEAAWQLYALNRDEARTTGLSADTQFAPFEWALASNAGQTAMIEDNGDVSIDFLSGGGLAASQTVRLARPDARLTATVRRDGPGTQDIVVSATCVSGGQGQTVSRIGAEDRALALDMPKPCRFARIDFNTDNRFSTISTLVTFEELSLR